jgi:hypothetical protein
MPDLKQFWTDQVATATAAETAAAADLAAAGTALDGPGGLRAAHATAGAALAAKAAEITAQRRSLTEPGLSPAELAARVAALRALLVEFRALRQAALGAEEALALGEEALEAARLEHQRLHAALQEAQAELAGATARADRLARWYAALAAEPLVSVAARATEAKKPNAAPCKPARLRVEGDIPAKLRTRAIERYEAELARAALARDAAAEADALLAEELEPVSGEAAAAAADLAAAEAALGDYVAHAEARLAAAVAVFGAIVASPPLTAAEKAAIAEPGRVAKGEAAVPKEKDRDGKRDDLAARRAALEEKKLELLAANIDEDLPNHPDVKALVAAIATLENVDLPKAEGDFTPAMRADLDDWEAAVPDNAWANLLSFEQAKRQLAALAAADPAALETAVTNAETALAAALGADLKRRRTLAFLRAAAAGNRRRNDVTLAVQDRRALGAVRGDQ